MKIDTTRFGEIDIKEPELIVMKGPIFGFEQLSRFVLLIQNKKTPLWWLQSAEDSSIAFVVINPRIIKKDYDPAIFIEDLEFLDIKNNQCSTLLAIVTVRSNPLRMTANIRAPILINAETRMARQVVLDDPDYPIQYDVLDHKAEISRGLSETGGVLTEWTSRLAPQEVV